MSTVNYFHIWILFQAALATAPIELLFLINNQENEYHYELSRNLQKDLIKQSQRLLSPEYQIHVHIINDILNNNNSNNNNNNNNKYNTINKNNIQMKYIPGVWTILHTMPQLFTTTIHNTNNNNNNHINDDDDNATDSDAVSDVDGVDDMKGLINDNTKWIIVCDCTTFINVTKLLKCLQHENYMQPQYLGYPLYDREPTIIHHFAYFENPMWFPYPMLTAGVIFTAPLFKGLVDTLMAQQQQRQHPQQQQQEQQEQQQQQQHYHCDHHNNINHHNSNSNNNNSNRKQTNAGNTDITISSEFSIDASHELARFIYHNVQILETIKAPSIPIITTTTTMTTTSDIIIPYLYQAVVLQPEVLNASIKSALNANEISVVSNINKNGDKYKAKDMDNDNDNGNGNVNDNDNGNVNDNDTVSDNGNIENIMRWQKIIMRKASYICPGVHGAIINNNEHQQQQCAMYARSNSRSNDCNPVKRDEIYFAVKTCHKYHYDRLPIVQSTWAQYAKYIKYFSDRKDDSIPTVNVGVPNVEIGHCTKTLQIIRLALKDIEKINRYQRSKVASTKNSNIINWLVLTDDDTLLSVSGVCQILGCHDPTQYVYLGERYGYRLHALDGFNYITGGGGIVFSLPTLRLILKHCTCPSSTAPDDMILGSCLHTLQLTAMHSMRFHQARPQDYPIELLQLEVPISFHKFWQLDPLEVYNKWFASVDRNMLANERNIQNYYQRFSTQTTDKSKISMTAKQQQQQQQQQRQKRQQPQQRYQRPQQVHRQQQPSQSNSILTNNINVPVNVVAASAALHHTNKRHIDL